MVALRAATIRNALVWFVACAVAMLGPLGCGEGALELDDDPTADVVSPTATQIAFVSDRDGFLRIYLMNTDGSDQRPISDPAFGDDTWPAWSPDGSSIAFVNDGDGGSDIYAMDASGGGRMNLTNSTDSYDTYPAWSPDGAYIAFMSDRDKASVRSNGLYVMQADGAAPRRLADIGGRAAWSPDGTRLVATARVMYKPHTQIMDATGAPIAHIEDTPAGSNWVAWSPDGLRLAICSDNPDPVGAYEDWLCVGVMDITGAHREIITKNPRGSDEAPTWSPDGERIAYVAHHGNTVGSFYNASDIHVVNLADMSVERLTHTRDYDGMPAWSP